MDKEQPLATPLAKRVVSRRVVIIVVGTSLLATFLVHRQLGTLKFAGRPFAIRSCEAALSPIEDGLYESHTDLSELESAYDKAVRNARLAHIFVPAWRTLVDGSQVLQDHAGKAFEPSTEDRSDYAAMLYSCLEAGRPLNPNLIED